MNKPIKNALVPDAKLHNPKLEKVASTALQQKAYEVAYAKAEAELEAAVEVERKLPEINARLEALERKGTDVNVKATLAQPAKAKAPQNKVGLVDLIVVQVAAEFLHRVKVVKPENTIETLLPGEQNTKARKLATKLYRKGATSVAGTTDAGWAAELVSSDVLAFWTEQKSTSVIGALASLARRQELGLNNSLTIPMRAANADIHAGFVTERASIPVKSGAFASATLYRHKCAVISSFSNELAETSTPNIEMVIRESVVNDTSEFLDGYILDPTKNSVPAVQPGSPFFGAPNQASAGATTANVITDLKWLIGTLITAKARVPVLILNPLRLLGLQTLLDGAGTFIFRDEIAAGTLLGVPFVTSTNVPLDQVYGLDADTLVMSSDLPEVDLNGTVTLAMADDSGIAPTMVETDGVTEPGSINVSDAASTIPPTEVRSMFQTNATALRYVLPITWGSIAQKSAYLTGVAW